MLQRFTERLNSDKLEDICSQIHFRDSRDAIGYALELLLAVGLLDRLQPRLDHIEGINRQGSSGTGCQARQEGAPGGGRQYTLKSNIKQRN